MYGTFLNNPFAYCFQLFFNYICTTLMSLMESTLHLYTFYKLWCKRSKIMFHEKPLFIKMLFYFCLLLNKTQQKRELILTNLYKAFQNPALTVLTHIHRLMHVDNKTHAHTFCFPLSPCAFHCFLNEKQKHRNNCCRCSSQLSSFSFVLVALGFSIMRKY